MSEFDRYRKTYETDIDKALSFSGQSQDFFTRAKADSLAELLTSHFGQGAAPRVLDIGCAFGSIHPLLRERWPQLQLTGIDVASDLIAEARTRQPDISYDVYDGITLPYGDATFDAAFTICVMHHVPPSQWPAFVNEMRRVVRPGGIVVVIEHNPFNPLTRYIVATCPIDENAVLLRCGQVMELMRGSGLEELRSRYILFTPFSGSFFRSFDRTMSWLPLGAQYLAFGSRS